MHRRATASLSCYHCVRAPSTRAASFSRAKKGARIACASCLVWRDSGTHKSLIYRSLFGTYMSLLTCLMKNDARTVCASCLGGWGSGMCVCACVCVCVYVCVTHVSKEACHKSFIYKWKETYICEKRRIYVIWNIMSGWIWLRSAAHVKRDLYI